MKETKKPDLPGERLTLREIPPWFLSREAFNKVNAVVPRGYFARMRLYFDLYGCLVCGNKHEGYFSSGMCVRCSVRTRCRLQRCDREIVKRESPTFESTRLELVNRIRSARQILADLKGRAKSGKNGPLSSGALPRVVTIGLESKGARRRMP